MLVDYDGQIVRDESGNIVFEEENTEMKKHEGDKLNRNNRFMKGYILADDGTKIEAYKNLSTDKRFDTNCHGFTFADGQYWINDNQVEKILEGDGYIGRINNNQISESDITVFYNYYGVVHSETVTDINSNEIIVTGLGGLQVSPTSKTIKSITPDGNGEGGGVPYIFNIFYYKPK